MKRIAIILATLALLLSACVNTVPTPDTDADPVVELSASAAPIGSWTNVTATVTDDTPGARSYEWRVGDAMVPTESSITHPNTQGLTIEVGAPSVSNGEITNGHTTTYTFEAPPYLIDGDRIGTVRESDRLLMHRHGSGVELFTGDPVTVADDILGVDHRVSFLGGDYGEWIPQGARFTIGSDTVDLRFGEPEDLSLEGYTVTVNAFNYTLDTAGELASVSIQATYTYDGLTQQQQIKMTPNTGVQVTLPEGTVVEAYLEGGIFTGLLTSGTFSIDGQAKTMDIGAVEMISNTTFWVESARLEKTPNDTSGRASAWVGGVFVDLRSNDISTRSVPGFGRIIIDDVTVELSDGRAVITDASFENDEAADQAFGIYEWRIEDETLYFIDRTTIDQEMINSESLAFKPTKAATYDVNLEVTDDRGHTGTGSTPVVIE